MAVDSAVPRPTTASRSRRRRWLARVALYSPLAALVAVILLDPFSRQWLLGPKIDGVPLCYWQDQLRMRADPKTYQESLPTRLAVLLGLRRGGPAREMPPDTVLMDVALSLIDDSNPLVRASLPRLLVRRDASPTALAAVVRPLLDDPDPSVRAEAASWLRCCEPAAISEPARARLMQMLDDTDSGCRVEAAASVCRLTNGQSARAETILRLALDDTRFLCRMVAMETLCYHGKQMPGSLPAVCEHILHDSANSVRRLGASSVHHFGAPSMPLLVQLLEDPDNRMRRSACRSLAKLGAAAKDALPALQQRLGDADEETRSAAVEAMHLIDPDTPPRATPSQR